MITSDTALIPWSCSSQVAAHNAALSVLHSVVTELRTTLAGQNTTQSDDVNVLNSIIAEQNSTIAGLTSITLQHSLAISAQNVSISNLTQTLEPFPVFNKLRVGNSVYNMYSASLPVQRIQNTSDTACTVGSDPLFPYGAVGPMIIFTVGDLGAKMPARRTSFSRLATSAVHRQLM
jgi:uncharacterized coiled-coil protein SlyX